MQLLKRFMRAATRQPSCEEVNQFLVGYLDESLDDKTRGRFENHISMCSDCAAYFEQYEQTVTLARQDPALEFPPELVDATLAFLRERRADQ